MGNSVLSVGTLAVAIALLILPWTSHDLGLPALYASASFALVALVSTAYLIPLLGDTFKKRNLKGRDRLKREQEEM